MAGAAAMAGGKKAPPLSLRALVRSLRMPRAGDLLLSLKTFGAATLALAVAFAVDLQNPYWAALTAYVVTIPSDTGAIRSKALFRLGGTLVGGVLALALAAVLVDRTAVLLVVYLAAISVLMWLQQIDRTPLGYAWFSIAVTLAVIGLATLQQPANLFDYATARTAESALGIAALLLIDSLICPQPMTSDFLRAMDDWRDEAKAWIGSALCEEPRSRADLARQLHTLTAGLATVDGKAAQLPFDTVAIPPRMRDLDRVRFFLAELVADCAAIETWAREVRRAGDIDPGMTALMSDVARWARDDGAASAASLRERCERRRDPMVKSREIQPIAERRLADRLASFVRNWTDLAAALGAVRHPGRPADPAVAHRRRRPVRNIDYWSKAFDVLPLPLATGTVAILWYVTAWDSGSFATVFAFIGSAFLIGQPGVLSSAVGIVTIVVGTFALVLVYQFAVLPRVTAFPTLIAVLGVLLVPAGVMLSMNQAGVLICSFTFGFLSLRNGYSADAAQTLLTLGGAVSGLLIATAALYLCSYDRPRRTARRLLRVVRRDIVALVRSDGGADHERFRQLTVDRLAAFFDAAARLPEDDPLHRAGIMADFRFGTDLNAWLSQGNDAGLRDAVAAAYRRVLDRTDRPEGLRPFIEGAIARTTTQSALDALHGMRLAAAA